MTALHWRDALLLADRRDKLQRNRAAAAIALRRNLPPQLGADMAAGIPSLQQVGFVGVQQTAALARGWGIGVAAARAYLRTVVRLRRSSVAIVRRLTPWATNVWICS